MDKAEIMSLLGHEGKNWGVKENRRKQVTTSIPYPERKWPLSVTFYDFTEQEVCDLLDREFVIQLRDKLPELVEQAHTFAKEQNLYREWYHGQPVFDICGVFFKKDLKQSFFMLEFDAGDNPDEFQEEWMISIGFDRSLRLTGEIQEESIWR